MAAELIHQPTPDQTQIREKREALAGARRRLAEQEGELGQLRAQLKSFEARYLRQVGVLYAELDDVQARIAEREASLYDSAEAYARAKEARARAEETHEAAFGAALQAEEVEAPPSLKTLFRELVKLIHPDRAQDATEATHFTLLMSRANQAYARGDLGTLQRLLDDHRDEQGGAGEDTAQAELQRISRQLLHAHRDLAALEAERHMLLTSEIAGLYREFEHMALQHRDLLTELAEQVREQIAEVRHKYDLLDKQMAASR